VDNHKGSITITEEKVTVQAPATDPIELVPDVYLTEPEVKCGQTITTYIVATFFSLDQRKVRSVMSDELWGTRLNHSKSVSKASSLSSLCEALEGFFPPPESVVSMSGPVWHNHVWVALKNMDYSTYMYLTMSLAMYFFNVIEFKDGQPGIRTYMEGKVKKMICPSGTVVRWNETMLPKEERPKLKSWIKKHGYAPLIVVKGMETSMRLPERKITVPYVYSFVTSVEKMIGGQSGSYGWFLNTRKMITMPEPTDIVNKVTLSVAITAAKTYPYLKFEVDMPMSGLYKAVQAIHNHKVKNLKPLVTKKEFSSLAWPTLEKDYLTMVADPEAYLVSNISNTTPTPSGKLKLSEVLARDSEKKLDVYGPRSILIGSICGPAFFDRRYVSTWWGLGYSGVSSPFPLGKVGWHPGTDAPVQTIPPKGEDYVAGYLTENEFLDWVDEKMRFCIKAWANPIQLDYDPTFHLEGPPIEGRTFLRSEEGVMTVYEGPKVSFKKEKKSDPVFIDDEYDRVDDEEEFELEDEDNEPLPAEEDIEGGVIDSRDDVVEEEEEEGDKKYSSGKDKKGGKIRGREKKVNRESDPDDEDGEDPFAGTPGGFKMPKF